MAGQDETLKEDDIEIIEVAALPTEAEIAARAAGADTQEASTDGDHDEDEGEDDVRLGEDHSQDGDTDAVREARRQKQRDRKRSQKEARDRTLRDLDAANRRLSEYEARIARLEGATVTSSLGAIDDKLSSAKAQLASLDGIIARAIEAGNGDDVVEAQRLRDSTRDFMASLETQKVALKAPAAPTQDPRIASLANQWKTDNSHWYDGTSEDSRIANAIEAGLAGEGFDPGTVVYWQELTKRTARRLGVADAAPAREEPRQQQQRREPPPMGSSREHAPASTRTEVYVTPERKQAMQDAGIWDDPVRRARVLKEYAEHDRNRRAG